MRKSSFSWIIPAAAALGAAAGCVQHGTSATSAHVAPDVDSGARPDAATQSADASPGPSPGDASPPTAESGAVEDDGGGAADSGEAAEEAAAPPSDKALIRLANFAPDAPAAGYDMCLAPAGTTQWTGPLLASSFPSGSLGQGGANGIQFPYLTQYFPVAPGTYGMQLIVAGGTCDNGTIPATYGLPELVAGGRTTFIALGDVAPTAHDAALKIIALPDEASASGGAALRVFNAIPSIGYADVGTGSEHGGDFSPLFTAIAFSTTGMGLADGGTADHDGYALLSPASGIEISAHATGMAQTDSATTSNVSLASSSSTTMFLVNGKTGGNPPQILTCVDSAPLVGAQSACNVAAQ